MSAKQHSTATSLNLEPTFFFVFGNLDLCSNHLVHQSRMLNIGLLTKTFSLFPATPVVQQENALSKSFGKTMCNEQFLAQRNPR